MQPCKNFTDRRHTIDYENVQREKGEKKKKKKTPFFDNQKNSLI